MVNSWGVRSLSVKLTLAFLAMGIIAILCIGLIVGGLTRRDFDRFVRYRFEETLANELVNYYATNQSWEGVDLLIDAPGPPWERPQEGESPENAPSTPSLPQLTQRGGNPDPGPQGPGPNGPVQMRMPFTIVNAGDRVVYSANLNVGAIVPASEVAVGRALLLNGERVGTVIVAERPTETFVYDDNERFFLNGLWRTIVWSGIGALFVAIIMGVILANTLTRPLRKLTEATQDVARGNLGRQVEIESKDELGDLARSFNHMSSDLAQSVNLRRQMTADIAHDLRTPLSVILGYTEALDEGMLPPSAETYAILHDEARHLSRLVEDLRILSLAEAGELRLERSLTSPSDLLVRAAGAHKVQADHAGITLEVGAPPDLPAVQVDAERFAQVLHNLVSNALRYTPEGGTITLGAQQTIGGIELFVRDTGAGIAPEHLPFVFERFYRADAARQQTGESGLGLPIAKSIVEMHGGTITVASEEGKGTTFTIHLSQGTSEHR